MASPLSTADGAAGHPPRNPASGSTARFIDEIQRHPERRTGDPRVVDGCGQLARDQEVGRGRRQRDEEVQREAKRSRRHTSLERTVPQHTARDELQHPRRRAAAQARDDERVEDVQQPRKQPAEDHRVERLWTHEGILPVCRRLPVKGWTYNPPVLSDLFLATGLK